MTRALSIRNLRKTYGASMVALKGISFDVEQGDFFALLGPNGAGKSTTIGIICSLVNKTSGTVKIFGHDIDEDFSRAKHFLGVVPQEFNFSQFERVYDIVRTQAGYFGLPPKLAAERTEKYLRLLSLWDKRFEPSRMLSGGMKRRLLIARALVHEPKLLILDEPTAGVDIELRRSMWEFLRDINASGTTIILTTHYLEEAESLCRNIAIIDQGTIVQNSSMRSLLRELSRETFILDLHNDLETVPEVPGFQVRQVDTHTIAVVVEKGQVLNEVFDHLTRQGLEVSSMRNKANRLEELFVALVSSSRDDQEGAV